MSTPQLPDENGHSFVGVAQDIVEKLFGYFISKHSSPNIYLMEPFGNHLYIWIEIKCSSRFSKALECFSI